MRYFVTDLDSGPFRLSRESRDSYAFAISRDGIVVGQWGRDLSYLSRGDFGAFRWHHGIHSLGVGSWPRVEAYRISDGPPERIVGRACRGIPVIPEHAILWTDGAPTDLNPILAPASFSRAHDVNADGIVVGTADSRAFRLDTTNGQVAYLAFPGETVGNTRAVNAAGHVAGSCYVEPASQAFLHDGATMHNLGSLSPGEISEACGGPTFSTSRQPTA